MKIVRLFQFFALLLIFSGFYLLLDENQEYEQENLITGMAIQASNSEQRTVTSAPVNIQVSEAPEVSCSLEHGSIYAGEYAQIHVSSNRPSFTCRIVYGEGQGSNTNTCSWFNNNSPIMKAYSSPGNYYPVFEMWAGGSLVDSASCGTLVVNPLVPPSVSVSHSPESPSSSSEITFTASASHPDGVDRIRVYVNGDLVRTCTNSNTCSYTAESSGSSALPVGNNSYYADARANNNVVASTDIKIFELSLDSARQFFTDAECVRNTGSSATIAVVVDINPTINGVLFEPGDEVGVFTTEGLCSGRGVVWSGVSNHAISPRGNNMMTDEKDGFYEGETIYYRVWQRSTNTVFDNVAVTYEMGNGLYQHSGIYVLASLNAVE